jgi:hypothetical protein
MTEWLPLSTLFKPLSPSSPNEVEHEPSEGTDFASMSEERQDQTPKAATEKRHYPGLNRVGFILRFIPNFILGLVVGRVISEMSLVGIGPVLLGGAFTIVLLYFIAQRLRNMGYPGWTCVFGLLPIVGFALFLFCLFCPTGHRNAEEKSRKAAK